MYDDDHDHTLLVTQEFWRSGMGHQLKGLLSRDNKVKFHNAKHSESRGHRRLNPVVNVMTRELLEMRAS